MSTLVSSVLNESLSSLRLTKTAIKDWMTSTFSQIPSEPRHAIMCLREIYYVMRYDVVKSDVCFSRRA